jgi:hypothetical protein
MVSPERKANASARNGGSLVTPRRDWSLPGAEIASRARRANANGRMHAALRVTMVCALFLLPPQHAVRGDAALPANVLDPQSDSEAWNVIRLATANVLQLLKEKRLSEIPLQVSLCSPALRTLTRLAPPSAQATRREQQEQGISLISSIARASQANDHSTASEAFSALQATLAEIAQDYDEDVVRTEIYICPMHPEVVSVKATTPCDKCGMDLVPRRIPHSFIYVAPGEPSIRMRSKRGKTPGWSTR